MNRLFVIIQVLIFLSESGLTGFNPVNPDSDKKIMAHRKILEKVANFA